MNKNQFTKLHNMTHVSPVVDLCKFVAPQHKYRNHTLLYGYTINRLTYHMYYRYNHNVSQGEICCLTYERNDEIVLHNLIRDSIPEYNVENCILFAAGGDTIKRLYPERCNFHFCRNWALSRLSIDLPFTSFNNHTVEPNHGLHGRCLVFLDSF